MSTLILSEQQNALLAHHGTFLVPEGIALVLDSKDASSLTEDNLIDLLSAFNLLYRAGMPAVTDQDYDHIFLAELIKRDPTHDFLNAVEAESDDAFEGKVVDLSQRMLSTDKAYDAKSIKGWVSRITKAAEEANIDPLTMIIDITPKLDGFAALDDGESLCTRGNGYRGTDISRVFERGLQVAGSGKRGLGAGEIVVDSDYFDEHLVNHFDNTRNFQSSIIKEKALGEHAQRAIDNGAAVFFPFSELPRWQGTIDEFQANFESLVDDIWGSVPFDVDGVVIEAPALRELMGHTSHHHRNTIAFKRNEDAVAVRILDVTFQTGKSGKITPVAELEPTKISGAVLSRATLHNVGWAEKMGVGTDAVALIVRSGLVIPKVVGVESEGILSLPGSCGSCGSAATRDGDNLYCSNKVDCSAQVESKLEYFFKTLGSCDGFGVKALEKLNAAGINKIEDIYNMTEAGFLAVGFGEGTTANLLSELDRSIATPVEDWRFLASFSLHNVGRGGCERLLKVHPIEDIFNLTKADLIKIDGFADKKADALLDALGHIEDSFNELFGMGFNLTRTVLEVDEVIEENPIMGKTIVFTGAMQHGKRDDMKKEAKAMGAKVGSTVTSKTDYLVIGEKVGATKVSAALANGTEVIEEADYLKLIGKSAAPKMGM